MDASYTGAVANGSLTEVLIILLLMMRIIPGCILTDFPDNTPGSYTISVEDDAGNKNIVTSEVLTILLE